MLKHPYKTRFIDAVTGSDSLWMGTAWTETRKGTERQADRQTDRQTDRETDMHT